MNHRPGNFTALLEEDADEVLLGLLARDNEPPAWHGKPHRRYVVPPSWELGPRGGHWRPIADDWWVWVTDEEYELAIGVIASMHRLERKAPIPEPVDTWLIQQLAEGHEFFQLWRYQHHGLIFVGGRKG